MCARPLLLSAAAAMQCDCYYYTIIPQVRLWYCIVSWRKLTSDGFAARRIFVGGGRVYKHAYTSTIYTYGGMSSLCCAVQDTMAPKSFLSHIMSQR